MDPYYEAGGDAKCNEILCCRSSKGEQVRSANRAGGWGDYRKCDTPERTVDNMFKHISLTHLVFSF